MRRSTAPFGEDGGLAILEPDLAAHAQRGALPDPVPRLDPREAVARDDARRACAGSREDRRCGRRGDRAAARPIMAARSSVGARASSVASTDPSSCSSVVASRKGARIGGVRFVARAAVDRRVAGARPRAGETGPRERRAAGDRDDVASWYDAAPRAARASRSRRAPAARASEIGGRFSSVTEPGPTSRSAATSGDSSEPLTRASSATGPLPPVDRHLGDSGGGDGARDFADVACQRQRARRGSGAGGLERGSSPGCREARVAGSRPRAGRRTRARLRSEGVQAATRRSRQVCRPVASSDVMSSGRGCRCATIRAGPSTMANRTRRSRSRAWASRYPAGHERGRACPAFAGRRPRRRARRVPRGACGGVETPAPAPRWWRSAHRVAPWHRRSPSAVSCHIASRDRELRPCRAARRPCPCLKSAG